MLSDDEPAHPLLGAIAFGSSIGSAAWLLPVGHPFQRDPLMLVLMGTAGVVAGRMLLVAAGRRTVAAGTSLLVLASFAAIHVRQQRGTWSSVPVPLLAITALAVVAWVPQSPRGSAPPGQAGAGPTATPRGRPGQITHLLVDRWAVFGEQLVPLADQSGQGRIHPAVDTWDHRRQVVCKLPHREYAELSARRLAVEAELMRACRGSPHVVRMLDCGLDPASNTYFVILARHGRGSLARFLDVATWFPLRLTLAIGDDVLRGLVDLQEHCGRPIAHGDLNPRNLLQRDDVVRHLGPSVVICDLGMARRTPTRATQDRTRILEVAYSPWYGAPELLLAPASWDVRADIYGTAAVLYELVTGQPPLRRESARLGQSFSQLVWNGVRPVSAGLVNPDLPSDLVDLLDRCLAFRPDDRPGTAREMLACVQRLTRGSEDRSVPFAALRRWDGPVELRSA